MTITVIEVKKDGKVGYLRATSIFCEDNIVSNPTQAKDYTGKEDELNYDLSNLVVPGDEIYARSGVRIDELPVVKVFEIELKEIKSYIGRELNIANRQKLKM